MRIRCLVNSEVTGKGRSVTGYPESSPQMHSRGHSPAALQQPPSFQFDNNRLMSNMTVKGWQVGTLRLAQVLTSSCPLLPLAHFKAL